MFKVVYNNCFGGFSLSDRAVEWLKSKGLKFDFDWEIPRHHPLLVQCVEALKYEASGEYADLAIKEVNEPYIIKEYDGSEKVLIAADIKWIDPTKY